MHNVASWLGAQTTLQAVVALTGVAALTASAATSGVREHQITAAALYNIMAFTEWPGTAFASPDSPLVVGVLGNGPIAKLLEEFLANENWQGRRVVLRRLSNPAEVRFCHVLYVERSEQGRWPAMASGFARLPILTVSDTDHFARDGGVVQLAIERNKLQLVVNLGVAHGCGLTISSKVLRLANVINNRAP
jgi:hypothetical protein